SHREVAMKALAEIGGEKAADAVARRLASHDREAARKALVELGPVAERATVAALAAKDRAAGLVVGGLVGTSERLAVLADKDAATRREACLALKAIGTEDSLPALRDAAEDKDKKVAEAALEAIKGIKARE